VAIIRLSEPIVWGTLRTNFCCCQGVKKRGLEAIQKESLNTFLATSFSVELVYIILKSITLFNKEELSDKKKNTVGRTKIVRRIDKSMFKLEKIKIKDPAVWDVLNTIDESKGPETAEQLLEDRRKALRS
jgi:hypothetical protein